MDKIIETYEQDIEKTKEEVERLKDLYKEETLKGQEELLPS